MESGKDHRRELGKQGEALACEWLRQHGHAILERNWRSGHLEIDIITFDAEGIHFVEVKARKESIQAPPQDNVNTLKQKRLAKAAGAFLNKTESLPFGEMECFFDVIAVTFHRSAYEIEWIPQAYIPIYT